MPNTQPHSHIVKSHDEEQRRLMGELVEFDSTQTMFTTPRDKRTQDYITGRFG